MDLSHNHLTHLYDCSKPTRPYATFDNNSRMEGYTLQQHNPSLTTSEWMLKNKYTYAFDENKTPLPIYDVPQSKISGLTTKETRFDTYENYLLQPPNLTEILNGNKLVDRFSHIDDGEAFKFEENIAVFNPIDVISQSNRLQLRPDTYDYPINNYYNNIYNNVNILTPHFIGLTESSEDHTYLKYPNYLSFEKENIYSESFKSNIDTTGYNSQLKLYPDYNDTDIKKSSANYIQNVTNSLNIYLENQKNDVFKFDRKLMSPSDSITTATNTLQCTIDRDLQSNTLNLFSDGTNHTLTSNDVNLNGDVPYTVVSTKSGSDQNNIDNVSKKEGENSTETNKNYNKKRFNAKKENVNAEALKSNVDVCVNKKVFLNASSSTTLKNSAVINPPAVRYTIDNYSQRKRLKLSSDDKAERIDFSADENLLLLSNFSDNSTKISTGERDYSTNSRKPETKSDVRKKGEKRRRDSYQTLNAPKKFRSEVNVPVGAYKEKKLESRNHLNWELYNFSKPEDCFEAVRNQWITSSLPNPHEDATCRFYNTLPRYNSKFTIQGSTDNIVECLSVYENQIMEIEHEMSSIEYTLDNFGSTLTRRAINQNLERWNKLKGMKERLNDACEDAHRFYTYYRDDRTGWNAYCISEYHNNEIKHQFDVMSAYEEFYGFS